MSNVNFVIENNIIKGLEKSSKNQKIYNDNAQMIFNAIKNYGDRVAQIQAESGEKRTYKQIQEQSIRCALWLKKQGIGKGDIVSLCTNNQLDAVIPLLATIYVGAVFNGWYHILSLDTARHFVKLVKPKVIFTLKDALSVIEEAVRLENSSTKIVTLETEIRIECLHDITCAQSNEEVKNFKPQIIHNPTDPGVIFFSSGTTGLPKAVVFSHDTMLGNLGTTEDTKIDHRTLWYNGYNWISGFQFTIRFLLYGFTLIFHTTWDPEEACKVIERYKVTFIFFTPYMMTECCKMNVLNKYDLHSIKRIVTGSMPLSIDTLKKFNIKFPTIPVIQGYGCTEFGGMATCITETCKNMNSVGTVMPNTQLKIIDINTKQPLGYYQSGEICLKSSTMMIGYFNNSTATKEIIDEDGWLHTGDLGHYNEDGEVFITDRLKEIMKYRGIHVSSSEIEQILLNHPSVMEVAVVPIPHDVDNERPMAFVKKVPGSQVTEEELIKLSSLTADYRKLRGGVKFVEEIPRTSTGKICRPAVKQWAKQYCQESFA